MGIEYLESLYNKSLELIQVYNDELETNPKLKENNPTGVVPSLEFRQEDFIKNTEWVKDSDVVFANATCFEANMVTEISQIMAKELKSGAIVIFTTKQLEDKENLFKLIQTSKDEMSWGVATIYVY